MLQGSSWRNCHESEVEWKEDECAARKTEDRGNGATSPESETAEPGQAAVARIRGGKTQISVPDQFRGNYAKNRE